MSDFSKLKDIFEMAEFLEDEGSDYLEISVPSETENRVITVRFTFNEDLELIERNAE